MTAVVVVGKSWDAKGIAEVEFVVDDLLELEAADAAVAGLANVDQVPCGWGVGEDLEGLAGAGFEFGPDPDEDGGGDCFCDVDGGVFSMLQRASRKP